MVGCAWYGLRGISRFALDSLTLNFSYIETATDVDMRRYFLEWYTYITYCVSEHQCLVPGHLGSDGMIMRILTIIVTIFFARCTEQIVWVGNVEYVPATEVVESSPRHGIHCLRFLFLYSVPFVRVLVGGQLRPQRLPIHPLQTTKIDSSYYLKLYNTKYCLIRLKSKVSLDIHSVHFLRFEILSETNSGI
jgi:hypothetical protein